MFLLLLSFFYLLSSSSCAAYGDSRQSVEYWWALIQCPLLFQSAWACHAMYWCSSYPSCRSAVSSAWIWIVAVELNFTYEFACFSIVSTGGLTKCTIQQDDCVGRERGSAKTFQKFIHRIWEWIREGRETQRIVAESRWNEVRGEIRWVSLEVVVFLMRSWNGWGGVYRKLLVKLRTNNEHSRAREGRVERFMWSCNVRWKKGAFFAFFPCLLILFHLSSVYR